jgi:hypothetical protein
MNTIFILYQLCSSYIRYEMQGKGFYAETEQGFNFTDVNYERSRNWLMFYFNLSSPYSKKWDINRWLTNIENKHINIWDTLHKYLFLHKHQKDNWKIKSLQADCKIFYEQEHL